MKIQQEFIKKYKSYGVKLNEPLIKRSIEFAVKYHGEQTRSSGEAYYFHPLEVARIIAEMKLDSDSIITAILHDTIEDTDLTYKDIEKHFSTDIAKLVDGVTKLAKIKFKAENVRQAENFRKLLVAMSGDIRVLLVKLADRLHNMRTIEHLPKPEKRKRIALETMEIYAPLAERIGMQQLKVELQDICFKVLHPKTRESIVSKFKHIESDKENYIEKIVKEINKTISNTIKGAKVSGRKKTPYSTWMKMSNKGVDLEQLSDIIAFRIIVKEVEDCYRALGVIHSEYKMVPGNFQDFISTPKNNGYQSIHTVVIGPLNQKIEVQIRTQEMHDIAELGVAAHWRYKQGHSDPSDGMRYNWLRELLAILEHGSGAPEDMMKNTKMAMYYNQVFCFTPKGDLIALPKGASIIDFAYMVSNDIANYCEGAKVNGREVSIDTELLNGDQIEIITKSKQTVSPEWEKFVVTGKARSEIQKATGGRQDEQYIKLGNNIIKNAFKDEKIENTEKAFAAACDSFKKPKNELLAAIGQGTITKEDILKQVRPRKNIFKETLSLLNFKQKKKKLVKQRSVPIKGLVSGMAIHYARCCHPIPGDKIAGVIHTGKGITIHTDACQTLENFSNMPDRVMKLSWDIEASDVPFVCRLNMTLLNEPSSLAVVSTEIARDEGNIINFNILNRKTDYFDMTFDIEVKSTAHTEKIINSLNTKKVVQSVNRARK